MITSRKRALDSEGIERSRKASAQRIVPKSAQFTRRTLFRDVFGNEYSVPSPDDLNARAIEQRASSRGGKVYFIRPQLRSDRKVGVPNVAFALRRGNAIRLLNLETRIESIATIADVMTRTSRVNSYGYVVLINITEVGNVLEPQLFNKKIQPQK